MSTRTQSPVEELDREELEAELESLREQVETNTEHVERKVDRSEARIAFAELASAISGRDIPRTNDMVESASVVLDEFRDLRETVDEYESFMESYGLEQPRDQDEAWVKIVKTAQNLANNPNHQINGTNEVALYIENIEAATGWSDRYCSDLIEEYGEEKQGTRWIAHEPASAANNHSATKKQLVVDLDVWGDA